jgi:hypothetical protein
MSGHLDRLRLDINDLLQDVTLLIMATQDLLAALDIDGTCQVCEQSYSFHANDCATRDVVKLVDELKGM